MKNFDEVLEQYVAIQKIIKDNKEKLDNFRPLLLKLGNYKSSKFELKISEFMRAHIKGTEEISNKNPLIFAALWRDGLIYEKEEKRINVKKF